MGILHRPFSLLCLSSFSPSVNFPFPLPTSLSLFLSPPPLSLSLPHLPAFEGLRSEIRIYPKLVSRGKKDAFYIKLRSYFSLIVISHTFSIFFNDQLSNAIFSVLKPRGSLSLSLSHTPLLLLACCSLSSSSSSFSSYL